MRNTDLKTIVWVDCLSFSSLFLIFAIAFKREEIKIRYFEASRIAYILIRFVSNMFKVKVERIRYSLGDMFIDNQSLGIKAEIEIPKMAHDVLKKLQERTIYKEIVKLLPPEKVAIYFEKHIKEEISSIVRLLLIIQWYSKVNNRNSEDILLCVYSPMNQIIQSLWEDTSIAIKLYKNFGYQICLIKRIVKLSYKKMFFLKNISVGHDVYSSSNYYNIAIHYREGLDTKTRSDLFWYYQSNIEPQKVFIILDSINRLHVPPTKELFSQIESLNMKWIYIHKNLLFKIKNRIGKTIKIDRCNVSYNLPRLKLRIKSIFNIWIFITAKELLVDIHIWIKLYTYLNIKICFDIGAQTTEAIAQAIALDFVEGIRVGVQRSTISLLQYLPFLRDNANHIFFTWGKEVNKHKGTSKIIKNLIISGFPFDYYFHNVLLSSKIKDQLKRKIDNKNFVVALFDNVFTNDIYMSENMVSTFYRIFLEWMIEDEDIIIISKEKKPMSIEKIKGLDNIISQANKTGRFIRLDDVLGRFPVDASYMADIVIGVGISSAVTESIIAGKRGIHCDLPKQHFHYFYKWGCDNIIFDDINRMMSAMKRYKSNRNSVPRLGDWSEYINEVDPFRDGRASERIGTYLRWCLEGFVANKRRDDVVNQANDKYALQWGSDKVMQLTDELEPCC